MKIFDLSIFTVILFLAFSTNSYAVGSLQAQQNKLFLQEEFGVGTMDEFLDLKAKDIRAFKQERIGVKDRIALKVVQRNIKKQLKKGETFNLENNYRQARSATGLAGFLLGFFLGLIGVLIAYLIDREIGNASWGGFVALLLLILVLSL